MEKKTLIAIVAMAVLGVAAFAVTRSPEKGQRVGKPPRPIPEVKASEVTELELTSDKQEKVALVREGGERWRVKVPADWPADPGLVKSLLDAMEKLSFGDLVTESTAKLGELGVEDGKAPHLVVKSQGKVLVDVLVGKPLGAFTMLRPSGKNEVWQSTGLASYLVNREPKAWRDHAIFEFAANDVGKLTVEAGAQKLVLQKMPSEKPSDADWKIVESTGDGPKTSETLDGAQATGCVATLGSLRAADFADDKQAGEVGLEHPALTISAEAKGKVHRLLVGTAHGDDVYVKSDESPSLYTIKKFTLERALHKPIDYRDKTLLKAKEADLQAVDITVGGESIALEHAGDSWKGRAAKGGTVDASKVKPVVMGLENVAASSFADEKDPGKTGLAKPTGSVTLRTKDKKSTTLKIGALKDGTDYYVQKVGSPEVLLVKRFTVDRFLKKPADLTTAPPAKK
jgi:hypothetical protein